MTANRGGHWHENRHPEIAPVLELVFVGNVIVSEPTVVGKVAGGDRLVSAIEPGGRIDGPRISGQILPGSITVELVRDNGTVEHEAKVLLGLDDGQNILCYSSHIMVMSPEAQHELIEGAPYDPGLVYSRGLVRFEAAEDGPYAWLNRNIFIAKSVRTARAASWSVWQIL